MAQRELELILFRQLASCLAMPIFLVDERGTLVFYNEPAEVLLGQRFEETGEMPKEEWASFWTPTDENGEPLPPTALPLYAALDETRPAHRKFWIRSRDGAVRRIEAVAFPLVGQTGRNVGAAVLFWERA